MSKILAVFFAFLFSLQAANVAFEEEYVFELKKDELARVFVTEKGTQDRDSFDFRWTLFDNTNIIVHTRYGGYPRQLTLSLRRGLKAYKQSLIPDYKMPPSDMAWLLLEFDDFKDAKATFKVYVKDEARRLDVEFVDPPKK